MNETTYVWSDLRERVIAACGDAPSAAIEERVIAIFRRAPALVATTIEQTLARYERGVIRSPWPIIANNIESAAAPGADVTATDSAEKVKAVARAKQWLRAAGMHFPNAAEVLDELFDGGMLKRWANDDALREEMIDEYLRLRPVAEQIEREEIERATAGKAGQRALREIRKPAPAGPKPEPVFTGNPFL